MNNSNTDIIYWYIIIIRVIVISVHVLHEGPQEGLRQNIEIDIDVYLDILCMFVYIYI